MLRQVKGLIEMSRSCFVCFLLVIFLAAVAFAQDIADLKTKAESGDAAAQLQLAKDYEFGKGVKADRFEAADWYMKAAKAGNAEAQNTTGVMLRTGYGGRKDPEEALKWFRAAAKQGYADAMFNLGTAYYNGDGVGISDHQALAWFLCANAFGSKPADDAVQRGLTDLQEFRQQMAILLAAQMLLTGSETPAQPSAAVPWLKKLADRGEPHAQIQLARMSLEGIGVPKDPETARQYCEQGAKARFATAMGCLGIMYRKGLGVPPNAETAASWYRKAADCGEANSLYALGQMYGAGEGVKQDVVEQYWLLFVAGTAIPKARDEALALKSRMDSKSIAKAEKKMVEFKAKVSTSKCVLDTDPLSLHLRH